MSKKLKTGFIRKDHILFDEKAHTYTNVYTGERYSSPTGILSKLKKKFETNDILDMTVKKQLAAKYRTVPKFLQPPKEILEKEFEERKISLKEEWDRLANTAAQFGTDVHEILEDYFTGEEIPPDHKYKCVLDAFLKDHTFKFKELLSEELVYADEYKIAGLADRIAIYDDESFSVQDYKTNKTFQRASFDGTDMLKYPFDNKQNCHLELYTIQMGIYAYLFKKKSGRKLRSLDIYWYDRAAVMDPYSDIKNALNDYSNINGVWVKIDCEYDEEKIKYLLENFARM